MEFLLGRMASRTAAPPPKIVTSFQVKFTTSVARAPHTNEIRKRRESLRSASTLRSRGSNRLRNGSRSRGLVFKGRRTPHARSQCLLETAIASRKHFRRASGGPSPPITSVRVRDQESRACRHCYCWRGGWNGWKGKEPMHFSGKNG